MGLTPARCGSSWPQPLLWGGGGQARRDGLAWPQGGQGGIRRLRGRGWGAEALCMTVGGVGSESWRCWGWVTQRTVPLILCPPPPPQGASANWWNHRHFQHHAKPNIFHKDPDVNMLHVFVLGESQPIEVGQRVSVDVEMGKVCPLGRNPGRNPVGCRVIRTRLYLVSTWKSFLGALDDSSWNFWMSQAGISME